MMRVSGVDRVVWVMTGVKGLTDVCWGVPEVDAGVDIVNEWLDWRPGFGYANARERGLWPSFDKKPGYILSSPKTNPRRLRLDCSRIGCHRCYGHIK